MATHSKHVSFKEAAKNKFRAILKDVYLYLWLIFIVAIGVMTFFFKQYVKGLVVISLLFLIFWYLDDVIFGVTGKTVSTFLARGHEVSVSKKFPLFFLAIVLGYLAYQGLQRFLNVAFPADSVNIVFVLVWLGLLYVLWIYQFSKE